MGGFAINPVLDGLMQAFSMANVMKHQRMQQEQLQLQKNKDNRQEQHEKFSEGRQTLGDQMAALNTGAKPLDAQGQYSQESSIPSMVPGLPATPVHLGGIPADPGRVAKIGGKSYQLASKDEQDDDKFAQAVRIGKANAEAHATAQSAANLSRITAQHEADQVELPGQPGKVSRYAIPYMTEQTRAKTQEKTNANTRASTEKIAAGNNATTLEAANIRANADKTKGGLTANGAGVQNRFDIREQDKAQKENQQDQKAEQALWGQYGQITTILTNRKTVDGKGVETDLNPLTESQLRQKAATIKKQIDVLQKAQKTRTENFGGTYSNGAATSANPYKTAAPAANPYR